MAAIRWTVHLRCGCWTTVGWKPAAEMQFVCSRHGFTSAVTPGRVSSTPSSAWLRGYAMESACAADEQQLVALADEIDRLRSGMRELWAALVWEYNALEDPDRRIAAAMRHWRDEFGSEDCVAALTAQQHDREATP